MRIGFISDTHFGLRSPGSTGIIDRLLEESDVVISGGDWGVLPFSIDDAGRLKGKIVSVAGNHDDPNVLTSFNILLEEGRPNNVKGLNVCPVHGAVKQIGDWRTVAGYRSFDELIEVLRRYSSLGEFICDILVMHNPPGYVYERLVKTRPGEKIKFSTRNPGVYVLDQIVATTLPRLVLCGHLHATNYEYVEEVIELSPGEYVVVPTLMLITTNDGAYALIDYDERKRLVKKIEVFSGGERVFMVKPRYRL